MNRATVPFFYLAFCILIFGLTRFHSSMALLLVPFFTGVVLIFKSDRFTGLLVILAYLSMEGAFKLLSGQNTLLRLAIDLLIIALFARHIQLSLGAGPSKPFFAAPFKLLFFLHVGWVVVEFLNPFSLGLVPSLAGYKVYVSSLLLYFLAYSSLETEADFRRLLTMALILICFQVSLTIFQFHAGESFLARWSSGYTNALGNRFTGPRFRPFGTSNVPGGSSTLIFLLIAPALGRLLLKGTLSSYVFFSGILAATAYALLIAQVRAAQVKTIVALSLLLALLAWKGHARRAFGALAVIGATTAVLFFSVNFGDQKLDSAVGRFSSLLRFQEVWSERSEGVYETTLSIAMNAPFGIGLSRVGAASQPFSDLIRADRIYGPFWSFADNLYKALLIEVGIPGLALLIAFLATTFVFGAAGIFQSRSASNELVVFQAAAIGLVLASISGHLGSEGFLYQPESGLVWIFIGSLVRAKVLASESR